MRISDWSSDVCSSDLTESLTKAGDLLGISQPAMSKYLRNTEDVLGYKLFIRKNGRLRPSAEAELLIPFVTGIFDNVFSARRAALDLRNNRAGRLTVAAITTLASELLQIGRASCRERVCQYG